MTVVAKQSPISVAAEYLANFLTKLLKTHYFKLVFKELL